MRNFSLKKATRNAIIRVEKKMIPEILKATKWNRRKAARLLEISYRTLLYKIKEYGLDGYPAQPRLASTTIKAVEKILVQRRTIPEMVRNFILKRDGFKCVHCGNSAINQLVIDHIYPFSKNGDTEIENLQTLCKLCNRDKRDKLVG